MPEATDRESNGRANSDNNTDHTTPLNKDDLLSRLDEFSELFDDAERRRRRAVHRIEIESDSQFTWNTTVEIDLSPKVTWSREDLIVPIARVPTGFLPHVELTDEGGVRIPTLTPTDVNTLVQEYIKLTWAIHFEGVNPSADQVDDITLVIQGNLGQRADATKRLLDAIVVNDVSTSEDVRSYLARLITTSGQTSLVCARIPLHAPGRVTDHRMLTLSYHFNKLDVLNCARTSAVARGPMAQRRRARSTLHALFRWVGAAPEVLAIAVDDALLDHPVHYEVQAPPELLFVRGTLVDRETWEPLTEKQYDVHPGDRVARVHAPYSLTASTGQEQPVLQVQLYPDRNGLHRRARSTAWWIAISTAVVIFFLPIIQSHDIAARWRPAS